MGRRIGFMEAVDEGTLFKTSRAGTVRSIICCMNTLSFNILLRNVALDPKNVYLVRHKDTRIAKGVLQARDSSPYQLWLTQPDKFEAYQRLQGEDCFQKREWIASFVVTPRHETLFAGIYRKLGCGKPPEELKECPVSGIPVNDGKYVYYDLAPDDRLGELKGRLEIAWGDGFRAWIQNADSKDSGDKKVLEIRKTNQEPAFPGYREFRQDIAGIQTIWPSWQSHLLKCKGIYLLTCKDHGELYVGKADGADGFWGKFCEYAVTGHGGNEGMRPHKTSGYIVTILEALATAVPGELDHLEVLWKMKLGSRKWGLNAN